MNPEYMAAGITHTIPEKLFEYFAYPLTNIFIILILVIMFANPYMLRKLWRIKTKDYITVLNVIAIGIYCVVSVISAVLVSRLGLHGTLAADDCDKMYMMIPRGLFVIAAVINIIEFVMGIISKVNKDKEYEENVKRGYFAEEDNKRQKTVDFKNILDSISSLTEDVKDKVNQVTEDVKDLINNRNNKE